ncbi:MOSC domain-containing protein [Candidatus Cyanaurora vandensis]|uniref:MOSC domain-containing protein n=1 Tax=Candidatus Cyanaurora vandensis TaxID=2714958 RepID=UPI00257F42AE|nr:MOSC N-terminal beta barrel domain-containing protein [Candidatus Cyanaurora vandensis]
MNPTLSAIWVYPIKSLDPVSLTASPLSPGGALAHDRALVMLNARGQWVNGKREPKIHQLRAHYDLPGRWVELTVGAQTGTFHLDRERTALATWLSGYFGYPVHFDDNATIGFPDDPGAWGPTLLSTATLEVVASWYPGLTVDQVRLRMRANLEITGVPAFWEDGLYGAEGEIPFTVGTVLFSGVNPCARCVVPMRDPMTGVRYPEFQRTFVTRRAQTLPTWVAPGRFDHFFRLSLNTRIAPAEATKTLAVGDVVLPG